MKLVHELTPFEFQAQRVRTVLMDGEPWFVAADVCQVLEFTNGPKAVRDHVKDTQKLTERLVLSGQNRQVTLINEAGLYRLIMRSRVPAAERFQIWVTEEVLPAIRKNGGYGVPAPRVPQTYAEALRELASEVEAREAAQRELEAARPAVEFVDTYVSGEGTYLMREVAAVLKVKGMGQNNLYRFLRDQGVLMSGGDSHNLPKRRHIDLGRFEVKVGTRLDGDGDDVVIRTVRVTGKGMDYIRGLLADAGYTVMGTVTA